MLKPMEHQDGWGSNRTMWLAGVASAAALLLSGCGLGTGNTVTKATPVVAAAGLSGQFMGGQQPVGNVSLQLYAAGTTGYGSAATALLTPGSSKTTPSGNFTLPSYTCLSATSYLYLVGTGGQPIANVTNPNLAMMVGLGTCQDLAQSNAFINVNEVTTVATVWALGRFMTGVANVGSPLSTNPNGLANAFAAINTVVNTSTGNAPGPALATGATLPIAKINALGNIFQNCINSSGGSASDTTDGYTNGTPCGKLFYLATPAGGPAPTDTITAAMNIAQNPGLPTASSPSYVVKLNALQSSSPAFAPSLSVNGSPSDWTIAINYVGGGLSSPRTVATDASGNVWVTNPGNNSVTELNNTGATLSGTSGYTAGSLNAPWGIAIDTSGNAWVTNSGNNSLTKLAASGATGTVYSGNGLSTPKGIAIDGAGDLWVANSGANTVSEFLNTGAAVNSFTGGGITTPTSIAINPK